MMFYKKIKIYGSHATGLNMPWSDLDLVLVGTESEAESIRGADLLSKIQEKIFVN